MAKTPCRRRTILEGLTRWQRLAISLRFVDRRLLREIAQRRGCTHQAVSDALRRGLRRLRGNGIDISFLRRA